jgi:hypothetical protein
MNTQSPHRTWIWVTVIVVVAAIGYFYLSGSSAPASSVVLLSSGPNSAAVGAQDLALLQQIQSLKIDTSLFSDPGYLTLRDYSVAIPPVNVGRPNPFAPLSGFSSSVSVSVPPAGAAR